MENKIALDKSKTLDTLVERNPLNTRSELLQVFGANTVVMMLGVMIGLLVARHFPVDIYGRLAYFVNLFGGFRLLAALGMTSQVIIQMSRCRGRGESIEQHFYPLLLIRILTNLGIVILTAGVGYLWHDSIIIVAAITAALALLNDFGVGALQGLGRIRRAIIALCFQSVVYALCAGTVIILNLPIQAIFVSFTISFVLSIILTTIFLAGIITYPIGKTLSFPTVPSLLRSAGGMYVLAICGTVFTSVVTLYLGWMRRFADVALLAVPLYLVFTPAGLVHTATITVYFPRLVALHAQGDQDRIQQLFKLFYRNVSAVTVLISLSLLFYPHVFLGLLYAERYQASASLLALVAPIAFLYTSQSVLTFTIAAQSQTVKAIPGAFSSVGILILAIAITAGHANDLSWFAGAYSLATLIGLAWQFRVLGPPLYKSLKHTFKQVCVAGSLIGVVRFIVGDTQDRMWSAIALLGLVAVIYLAWVWPQTGTID